MYNFIIHIVIYLVPKVYNTFDGPQISVGTPHDE